MSARHTALAVARTSPAEVTFTLLCEKRALTFADGVLSLQEAVDELQAFAQLTGLIDEIGQDEVQAIMAAAFDAVRNQSDGLDAAFERLIMLRSADLVRQWEVADSRDRWQHNGEQPPRMVETPSPGETIPHARSDRTGLLVHRGFR